MGYSNEEVDTLVGSLNNENAALREQLSGARDKLVEQDEILQKLEQAALGVGTVIQVNGGRCFVASDGRMSEVQSWPGAGPGVQVLLLPETGQITAITDRLPVGETVMVKRVEKDMCEIEMHGSERMVPSAVPGIEIGDRAVLDFQGLIIIQNLGKADQQHTFTEETGVSWDDIGGLIEAKKALIEAIEFPILYADLYRKYNKKTIKGVLLHGPAGCGKTMLGKACATALRRIHKGTGSNTGFIYVKGPSLLNKFVGNTEAGIRGLFAQARSHKKRHGFPAILFIDEADALLGSRDRQGQSVAGMETTVVPQFLSEMDGLEDSGAMVLLSTNLPTRLDAAVLREGRIDRKVKVTRPNQTETREIFHKHLRGLPLSSGSAGELAEHGAAEIFHEARRFYEVSFKDGRRSHLTLGNLVNGAMIAGIVDKATSIALDRDRATKVVSGISSQDLFHAVSAIEEQNRDLDHERDAQEILEEVQQHIEGVKKVRGERHVSANGKAKASPVQAGTEAHP